ncbi:hypothetical protein DFH08DRAFT_870476 [Mycena albidolilacea]|uniref:Uncharacterized protein n=1 Tax=Mycena albidolilacea TaxID=1033008 RepID=A0AAD7ERF3_9AGAR|nr:hypothetical protein DFH08DRAFT_870476 [Mycena albidolilacea]
MRTRTENNSAADKENSHGTASRRNKKNRRTSAPAPLGTHADTAGTGDEQVRELQAQLRSMQSALDRSHEAERAAEARAAAAEQHTAAPLPSDVRTGSVGRPNNIACVKMEELQQHLGFDDIQWNALRTCVRDALSAARLDLNTKWKAQAPAKLSMAYNAIEEEFPQLRRFPGQWGVDRIAKQCWSNRRSYRSCVGNQTTYRGRRAAARRATGSELPPHPCRRIHRRSTSRSDSDSRNSTPVAGPSHDDLLTFSDYGNDNEDGNNGDEEDLGDSTPNGKKRAAPAGESDNRKRQRRQ